MRFRSLGALFEAFSGIQSAYLSAAKWRPGTQGYGGYGSVREARVLGRVLMTRSSAAREWLAQRRGWRQFFDTQVPRHPVLVQVGDAVRIIETDLGGYIDLHVTGHNLPPGWQNARVHLINRSDWRKHRAQLLESQDPENIRIDSLARTARCLRVRIDAGHLIPIRIISDEEKVGIASDIDDTILVSMVPHKLLALRYALVDRVSTRQAVPGMAYFLNKTQEQLRSFSPSGHRAVDAPPPFIFVSTGAWNTVPVLRQFLSRSGFPQSTTLLRAWWFSAQGPPSRGPSFKLSQFADITRMLPHMKWILVGDNGQHDPEIYAEFAKRWPNQLAAVAIRTLGPLEHLSAHGSISQITRIDSSELPGGVPLIFGEDGYQLMQQAHRLQTRRMLQRRLEESPHLP